MGRRAAPPRLQVRAPRIGTAAPPNLTFTERASLEEVARVAVGVSAVSGVSFEEAFTALRITRERDVLAAHIDEGTHELELCPRDCSWPTNGSNWHGTFRPHCRTCGWAIDGSPLGPQHMTASVVLERAGLT